MRTWILKDEFRKPNRHPDDMMCIEIEGEFSDENMLVYIQWDGKWDISSVYDGLPTAHKFDEYER